ncbi:hypothetical protein CLOM_g23713 [Closterium sp. NIES-68]|nr:hypothetical protein CLOM_g23713 [Closterium sp. NIES-68]
MAGDGGGGAGGAGRRGSALAQELLLYVCSAGISALVLMFTFRQLDPNRAQAKIAAQRKKEIAKRLGRPYIQTNAYEDVIANDVINPQNIDVTFDSVGGLHHVKQSLHDLVILPLQRPELFAQGKLLRPQKGVLLYGPPGTGKTLLAKAIAKECRAVFINVRIANLMSKWFGDAQKLVTAVFTLAHKLQPAIIFIDEVDSFLGQRRQTEHEAVTNMKTEFMSLWDGFSTDDTARVMVLAATNRPWELDEAILRRLPRHFEIPLPDLVGRTSILNVILRDEDVDEDLDLKEIAALCAGYSGSDLTELCKQAAYLPLHDFLEDERRALVGDGKEPTSQRPLSRADFLRVLSESRPSKDAAFDYLRKRSGSSASLPHLGEDPNTSAAFPSYPYGGSRTPPTAFGAPTPLRLPRNQRSTQICFGCYSRQRWRQRCSRSHSHSHRGCSHREGSSKLCSSNEVGNKCCSHKLGSRKRCTCTHVKGIRALVIALLAMVVLLLVLLLRVLVVVPRVGRMVQ